MGVLLQRRSYRLLALALGLASSAAFAQPAAPGAGLYERPQTILRPALIAQLEQELAAPDPDLRAIVERAEAELKRYTGQFVEEKRIQDERRTRTLAPYDIDENTARLIALLQSEQYGQISFLGEAPYLYRLHTLLGRAFEGLDDPYRAMSEYAMAFRYTGLEIPASETPDQAERDRAYLLLLRGFADPDRLAQETDADLQRAGLRFRELAAEYAELQPRLAEAERAPDVAQSALLRGVPADPAAAIAERDQLRARVAAVRGELESIRTGAARVYSDRKRRRDGELAYRMALLTRRLEADNKNRLRILYRSSFYRGAGDQLGEERTALRDFVGYRIFLELAVKIDPENLTYLDLLADEYRSARLIVQAIAFEERYIAIAEKSDPRPENLPEHYIRLAGLYTDSRNYIQAAGAYERFLSLSRNPERRLLASLELANLHFARTGDLPRAQELYSEYLAASNRPDEAQLALEPRTELRSVRYRAQKNLAAIHRRRQRTAEEKTQLEQAAANFLRIEADYQEAERSELEIRRSINRVKAQLLDRMDDRLEREYYRLLRIDLPAARERLGFLKTRLHSLDYPSLLERRALIAFRFRELTAAQNLYREVIRRGPAEQGARARRNIELIRRMESDGVLRQLEAPAYFER